MSSILACTELSRNPFVWLGAVQDELIYNISHPASGVREVAYTCLVRLLRHAPTRWPAVLPGYMAALEVQYPAVTVTDLIEPREFLGKIVEVCGGARTL